MADIIKIKKGLDIPLRGAASQAQTIDTGTNLFGIVPDDFPGHTWKCAVKAGDKVLVGTSLLYSKTDEDIKLVSPVCGIVKEVRRGERRKIEAVTVEASRNSEDNPAEEYVGFETLSREEDIKSAEREQILKQLCHSGIFALFRQRPYDIVPDTHTPPRDIFVTAFDSAPLAAPLISPEMQQLHEKGLEILARLTEGHVFLNVPYDSSLTSRIAKVTEFAGPHPAGNVGVQIAKIRPVNRGETVWTLDSRTAVRIGILFSTGHIDNDAEVCICGDMAADPHIILTHPGASLRSLLTGEIKETENKIRVISGNVLTGIRENIDSGFLRYPYRQITLIAEGEDADEFLGWATLSPSHYSVKRTFPSFLLGKRGKYHFDSRLRGGRRAMILSGEMDKVFPFNIYPEFLLKAILASDIEKMEQLGIYEVAPEDFALPEFVDTSKQPLQSIVRQGLDYLRKELS